MAGNNLLHFICHQFQRLFTSNAGLAMNEVLNCVQQRVTAEMNAELEEMGDLKALGAHGFPAIFYKKFWNLIGDRVKTEVLQVLNGANMPPGWNDTIVVLKPKVKSPDKLKDLRPISLCTVLYKIASKVLANRLKKVLPEIISSSQSTFVPGRLITDNVLIAYEMTHYIGTRRLGKAGYAAIKT